jgi:hypothetical protein
VRREGGKGRAMTGCERLEGGLESVGLRLGEFPV